MSLPGVFCVVDYKYHVITVVAIFLALAIGILIGSTMLGDDFVGEQQKLLADRLERDFQNLRVQNGLTKRELSSVRETVKTYQEFCSQAMPALIKDKLRDKRVAVIQTGNSCELGHVLEPLRLAGTEIKTVVSVLEEFSLADVSAGIFGETAQGEQPVQILGKSILFGDMDGVLPVFTEKKLVTVSGTPGGPYDAVILVGGNEIDGGEQFKWVDLPLLDYFLENSVQTVGVEASSAVFSYMNIYQSRSIATIDNIETIPGKIALVYALLGETGNFGVKKTAKKLVPQLD